MHDVWKLCRNSRVQEETNGVKPHHARSKVADDATTVIADYDISINSGILSAGAVIEIYRPISISIERLCRIEQRCSQ